MFENLLDPVLFLAGLTAAVVAGVFLTFSDFVMRALGASAASAGAEAMQHINRVVYRSLFMVLLLGSVPLAGALLIVALTSAPAAVAYWMGAGALSYFLGVFVVTAFGNVPMNQKFDALDHTSYAGQGYWFVYLKSWTRLNHVRTIFSLVTAICYFMAAVQ